MNQYSEKLDKVRQIVAKGDKYKQQGMYQSASKCYELVTTYLKNILKQALLKNNSQGNNGLTNTMKEKIKKYQGLAAEMLVKYKENGNKQAKVSKFGFPQVHKVDREILPIGIVQQKKTQPIAIKSLQNQKVQVDNQVVGLIAKDIKASFDDIVGMKDLKQTLYEAVINPQKRPDLFKGIRSPPRGILLYGPPGNGKTFITKALAKESGCTFYGLSAGAILNKYVGQTQKMLRKVFDSAKRTSPSIIFIDEIDSMLTARSQTDNDAARRLKTEFLIQFDNLENTRVIVIGATNLPNELDLAALRRFNKLVYVGLPDKDARQGIVQRALKGVKFDINGTDMKKLVKDLDGYSASEITDIVKQACMMPIRQISKNSIETVDINKIRAVKYQDFSRVLKGKKPLLSKQDLKKYAGKFNT